MQLGRFCHSSRRPRRSGAFACYSKMHAILRRTRERQAGGRADWDGLAVSPRYKFGNEALIEWLEITPEEEHQLKTIISGDERPQRDHERDEKRSREAFMPLFTGERGRWILRSPYSAFCIDRFVEPPEDPLVRVLSIKVNATCIGPEWISTLMNATEGPTRRWKSPRVVRLVGSADALAPAAPALQRKRRRATYALLTLV